MSGICHLVGPGGGEFVKNLCPRMGPDLLFLLEAVNVVSFSIFHFKIYLVKYTYLDSFRYFSKEYF